MSVEKTSCLVITCDDCGEDCWDDAEGIPHWRSLEDARKALDDWTWTDTEQICDRCTAKRICDRDGHDWGEWRPNYSDPLQVYRFCDRDGCPAIDWTVASGSAS